MIVVTTPTGLIGHQVLDKLLDRGEPLRVIAREESALAPDVREHVDVVEASRGLPQRRSRGTASSASSVSPRSAGVPRGRRTQATSLARSRWTT